MKKFWWIIVIVIIVVLYFAFGRKGKAKNEGFAQQVKKTVVEKGEITIKLEETGEIQPVSEIEQKSKVSGKIAKLFFEEGDYIKVGDVIAEIEPDYNQTYEITQKTRNLRTAEIDLANAQRDWENNQKLYQDQYISQNELDKYADALERAQINYDTNLLQYESIKEIETVDNVSKVLAAASGTVITKNVEEGEMVLSNTGNYSNGTVLCVIADLSKMIVSSKINEVDIGKISKGMEVKIQVDAYPYESYSGAITSIAPMAQLINNVKVFPVEINIDSVDEKLRPGMTANITIIGEKRSDIMIVPIRAIFSDQTGNDIIYKVKNDTIAESSQVKTGINDFQKVEIISGVAEGDTISLTEPARAGKNRMDIMFN
ncbi:MAG: efflux RND transporter periplasmic adaptor subunit [Candidatus Stygibacter australis]|nr:efflux RND transporter periplasmic adaptor subunit [Candidatus Stygibacter australis]MDP8320925.1 efflux RND transporter periplasmic adaptor subunit [Candidatus Stygibacter australis]